MKLCAIVVGLLLAYVLAVPHEDNPVSATGPHQLLGTTFEETNPERKKRALSVGTTALLGVGAVGAAAVVGAGIFGVGALTGAITSRRLAASNKYEKPSHGWSNAGFYKKNDDDYNLNYYRSYYYPYEE